MTTPPEIKVPRGTILKVAGHPVKLKYSLYLKEDEEGIFILENHEIMDYEEVEEEDEIRRSDKSECEEH